MSEIHVDSLKNKAGTGAPDFPEGVTVTGVGTITGDLSVSGTVTYDDVTSVDSVGIVTARNGFRATAGGINVIAGVSTFANQIDANGCIDATGIVTASHGSRITAGGLVVTAGITTFTKDATFGGALKESVTTSTNTADVYNIDLVNGNVHKFDTNGTGAGTVYITYDGGNNVNTYMATNSTVSLSVIAKPNSAGYINAVQVDGTASGVTVEWSSDSAATPSSANNGAYDLYAFNIVKTGSSAYLVFASRTKFN